jgi:hypothetical protein
MGKKYFHNHCIGVPYKPSSKPMVSMLDRTLFMHFSFKVVDISNWVNRIILPRLLSRLSGYHPILSSNPMARIHPILYLFTLGAY